VIAVPAEGHGRLVRRALEAGKDVFVEKPLALHLGEAEDLCALADANRRVLMVGHLLQYHVGFLKLKELTTSGVLGRLLYVYSNRLNLGKLRREENILWSFAPHDISMILSLAADLWDEVWTTGACYLHRTIADVTTTHLRFANGINAHVFVSGYIRLVIVGDRAMAVFDDGRGWAEKLQLFPRTPLFHPLPSGALSRACERSSASRWIVPLPASSRNRFSQTPRRAQRTKRL
jgi:UDP-2-acetamido-3-amino-2,3-dideoxy-glucuronate N-acetyltransferase